MINKIIMNGVASYKQTVTISGLKKVNLFYGLNGTGKSTLSKYLAACNSTDSNEYDKCSYEPASDDIEIFAYNQDFVAEYFQESQQQQGIFTLDKANTQALKAITEARQNIAGLENQKKPLDDQIEALKQQHEGVFL